MTEYAIHSISIPERSEWQCRIAGVTWIPNKGDEPNWFWRKMQYLLLGAVWERRP